MSEIKINASVPGAELTKKQLDGIAASVDKVAAANAALAASAKNNAILEAAQAAQEAADKANATAVAMGEFPTTLAAMERGIASLKEELRGMDTNSAAFGDMQGSIQRAERELQRMQTRFVDAGTAATRGGSAVGAGGRQMANGMNSAGMATLEASRAFEDMQYGFAGVLNNIPGLVQGLGMTAGVAGAASVLAVVAWKLYQNLDKLTGKEKELAIQSIATASVQQSVADAVVEAMMQRRDASLLASSATDFLAFAVSNSARVWAEEKDAINAGTEAIKKRNQAQAEFDDAEKALQLAIIDAGSGTDAEKLEAKLAVEKEFRAKKQAQQLAEIDTELANAQKLEQAGARRSKDLRKQVAEYDQIIAEKKAAERNVQDLEDQQAGSGGRALGLYRDAILRPTAKVDAKFDPKKASDSELLDAAQAALKDVAPALDGGVTGQIMAERLRQRELPDKIKDSQAKVSDLEKRAAVLKDAESQLQANYQELTKLTEKIDALVDTRANKQSVFALQNGTEQIKGDAAVGSALEAEAQKNKAEDAKANQSQAKDNVANMQLGSSAAAVADLLPLSQGKNQLKAAAVKLEAGDMASLQEVLSLARMLVERADKSAAQGVRMNKEVADLKRRLNNQRSNDNAGE